MLKTKYEQALGGNGLKWVVKLEILDRDAH